ncbi:MAG: ABC transporter ATP-binding protein [Alphaproteobacteria bacterium]|nr:ABC transporter ATP-binding protein [Alphaproteobacteria bacterium]
MSTPAIELLGVDFSYPGSGAGVKGVDLAIAPGELLAVIGASGCGKTTLLKLIAGFLAADRGTIRIDGADMTAVPPRLRNLGVVFQSYALFPHMTAWENVAYGLKVRGVDGSVRRSRALATLDLVGLADFAGRRPGDLSGGQQQRVALARALVIEPRALLLDEPLSALDAARRLTMRDEIRRIQREHAIATVHITHDQEEALSMADRIALMIGGRIEQVGTPRELYDHPASRAVAAFVGHANLWDSRILAPDTVETPVGILRTLPHGCATGARVTVLVRPERVVPGPARDGVNGFAGRLLRDRFLGAMRRYDLAVAGAMITGETATSGPIEFVHIPPADIRILQDRP